MSKACSNYFCVDPCLSGTCKATDFCRVMNHRPICGFNYEAPPQVRIGLTRDSIICAEREMMTQNTNLLLNTTFAYKEWHHRPLLNIL